jgi:serine/threonine protein kinase
MPLNVGSRLGHYDVTALIGEGGMGQVYQATDTKLNRQVALKILPEALTTDPDRLERFQQNVQVLASLDHPGIAAIYSPSSSFQGDYSCLTSIACGGSANGPSVRSVTMISPWKKRRFLNPALTSSWSA